MFAPGVGAYGRGHFCESQMAPRCIFGHTSRSLRKEIFGYDFGVQWMVLLGEFGQLLHDLHTLEKYCCIVSLQNPKP